MPTRKPATLTIERFADLARKGRVRDAIERRFFDGPDPIDVLADAIMDQPERAGFPPTHDEEW